MRRIARALAVMSVMSMTATAHAGPKLAIQVTRVEDPDGKLDVASVTKGLPKLASCGAPPLSPATITVDVSAGAVTDVRIPGPPDSKFARCAVRMLKAMKLATTASGVVIGISVDHAAKPARVAVDPPPPSDTSERPPVAPTVLTQADVDLVMGTSERKFRQCYLGLLKAQPTLAGKFVYAIEIAGGRVTHTRALKPTTVSRALDRCMVAEIKKLTFPSRPAKTIMYPFVFQ